MALVKCKDCGEQVSTSAKSCPKCGSPPPRRSSAFIWLALILVVFAAYMATDTTTASTSTSVGLASSGSPRRPDPVQTVRKPQWEVSTSVEKMTGKRQAFASSPTVSAAERMDFPYGDVRAWLGVGCDGTDEWAYIGFSSAPNLTDTDTESGYNRIRTRIKWDESLEDVTLTQEWGAPFLHFRDDDAAIARMATAGSALLELNWYGQGRSYFSFPLDGSSASIATIRRQCSALR
jgi:RNA polymerase subunit RPABC4/transcription elongation factor Spt4